MYANRPTTVFRIANDRVAQAMASMLWALPLVMAMGLTGRFLVTNRAPAQPAPMMAETARQPIEKPIMTQAVVRPQRQSTPLSVGAIEPNRESLLALAFTPHVDTVASVAPIRATAAVVMDPPTATTNSEPPARFDSRLAQTRTWRSQTLKNVGVAEGLRLISGGAFLSLAGVTPLEQSAQCKRLDGVMEPCSIRAASRLEILTRGRTITCQVFDAQPGEPTVAKCKADKIDIADDLVKNGLARRA